MATCSRCGNPAPVNAPCPACGVLPPGLHWVATPPSEAKSQSVAVAGPEPRSEPGPYTGPPYYPSPPRWGFPLVGWRQPVPLTAAERGADDRKTTERVRALAATAIPLLWLTAVLVLFTAGAEAWRYTLLLQSRTDAVPALPLHASDALVITGGVISLLAAVLAAVATMGWLLNAYAVAARGGGVQPARSAWQLVAAVVVPGVNLLLPGAVLAELEHAALGRDPERKPHPSRLVVTWWLVWAGSLLLVTVTLLWGLRDGVQARADGVLLHIATDLLACAVAITTIVVVRRLTGYLSPVSVAGARRMVVVKVGGTTDQIG